MYQSIFLSLQNPSNLRINKLRPAYGNTQYKKGKSQYVENVYFNNQELRSRHEFPLLCTKFKRPILQAIKIWLSHCKHNISIRTCHYFLHHQSFELFTALNCTCIIIITRTRLNVPELAYTKLSHMFDIKLTILLGNSCVKFEYTFSTDKMPQFIRLS